MAMVDRGWEWFLACQVLLLCCCEVEVGRVGRPHVGTLYMEVISREDEKLKRKLDVVCLLLK